ncbi:MAG: HD domain-containing protein [Clostridiaceae bacterium]|nr:HD domain-containing protein [Clostridiaceae bacterium]
MEVLEIANKIKENGGILYLVGGAIRNEQMNKQINDEDYCVVGLSKEVFERLFPNAKKRGKFFGVYELERREFALARKEKKIGIGHKEFEIENDKNVTIEEDLKRRDITINSIAKNVLTSEIIDPYNGINDIKNKIIRATSDAFKEDPLRSYRVARFASIFNFEVDDNTINMMKETKEELKYLSPERVFLEFKKALEGNNPSIFFQILRKANILDVHFKEIYDLIGKQQPSEYHPEGDSYNHTMIVVDKSVDFTNKLEVRFSCLIHDLGKGITPQNMLPHHYGHDLNGVALVKNLGERLNIPQKWIKCGKVAAREHMLGGIFDRMKPSKQIDFITRVEKSPLGLKGMQTVVICDKLGKNKSEIKVKNELNFYILGKKCIQTINGKYIKEKYKIDKEKQIGELLRKERIEWIKKNEKNIEI